MLKIFYLPLGGRAAEILFFFIVHWAGTLKSSKKNIIVIGHWAGVLKSLICFIIDNGAGVLVFLLATGQAC